MQGFWVGVGFEREGDGSDVCRVESGEHQGMANVFRPFEPAGQTRVVGPSADEEKLQLPIDLTDVLGELAQAIWMDLLWMLLLWMDLLFDFPFSSPLLRCECAERRDWMTRQSPSEES